MSLTKRDVVAGLGVAATAATALALWKTSSDADAAADKDTAGIPGSIGLGLSDTMALVSVPLNEWVCAKHDRYGPVFKAKYLGQNWVHVSGVELAEMVLRGEPEYVTVGWNEDARKLLGPDAITTAVGERHAWHRATLSRALSVSLLELWVPRAAELFYGAMQEWADGGKEFELKRTCKRAVFDMTKSLFLGDDYDVEKASVILECLENYGAGFFAAPVDLGAYTEYGRALAAKRTLSALLKEEIERRLRENDVRRDDFVSSMMNRALRELSDEPEGEFVEVDVLADQLVGPLWGSLDSTASLMSLAGDFLSKHPDICDAVARECAAKSVTVSDHFSITVSDLERLSYVHRVVKEILRVYEPIAFVPRMCVREMPLSWRDGDGKVRTGKVPAGWGVAVSLGHTMRNVWNDETADPERWREEIGDEDDQDVSTRLGKKERVDFRDLSFSQGRRKCPGRVVARLELALMVVLLSVKYKCERTRPIERFVHKPFVASENGVWCRFKERL